MRAASAPAWGDDHAETDRHPRLLSPKKRKVGAVIRSTLLVFAIGVCGVTVYYFHRRAEAAEERATQTRVELDETKVRVAALDRQARDSREDLEVAQTGFATEVEKLRAERDTASQQASQASALKAKLDEIVKAGEGGVEVDEDRLTLSLVEKVLFRSGEAFLTPPGRKVLDKVGRLLRENPGNQIWVQGHTDDVPIATEFFPSNWELSSARALTVVHFLQDEAGIDPRRLAAVGMSQYRPVSKRHKARNRRIEIVLFPQDVRVEKD
jgi:chemotaxis protein MotB